jgi:hypothetical protein
MRTLPAAAELRVTGLLHRAQSFSRPFMSFLSGQVVASHLYLLRQISLRIRQASHSRARLIRESSRTPNGARGRHKQAPCNKNRLCVGAIKQGAELRPRRQIWCRSAPPWSIDLSGIGKVDWQ